MRPVAGLSPVAGIGGRLAGAVVAGVIADDSRVRTPRCRRLGSMHPGGGSRAGLGWAGQPPPPFQAGSGCISFARSLPRRSRSLLGEMDDFVPI